MIEEDVVITIDAVKEAMGDDADEFIAVMPIIQDMIDNPEKYHGSKAAMEAVRLAALRTKISVKCQYYKTSGDKSLTNRKRKDVLMAMYQALEENINALKLTARIDFSSAGVMR